MLVMLAFSIGTIERERMNERKTYNHAIMNVIQYTFIMSLNEN